jgi:L-asparaginase
MAEQTSSPVFSSSFAEMQSHPRTLVVLGTGGTIAGEAASPDDDLGYRAGSLPVAALVGALRMHASIAVESEEVAQLDSKDMDFATWRALAVAIERHLARAEVIGIVVTHGSDTLEETAFFLDRVVAPTKPVVLTAAMRPATSRHADGARNLRDACVVATANGARGVVAVVAGVVHCAHDVRKIHPQRLDAFGSGDAGPLGIVADGVLTMRRPWPSAAEAAIDVARLPADDAAWPWVEIVTSKAAADPRAVRWLVAGGCAGIVVATTGNGTVHCALESALADAAASGCAVLRATRCLAGAIVEPTPAVPGALPSAGALTPPQARVELIVRLLAARTAAAR